MFNLVDYMEDENGAILRCECKKIKTILFSDLESRSENYCVLKDGVELVCSNCGRKHTDKYIPLEPQTFSHIHIPTCPTCGSTNVAKISTAKKAIGFATIGVFSSNFGKTMCCRNCGYKW